MKTLEQVKEHLATTYYDCSDKICGFIVGCELKEPKEVIKFLKEDDYVYNFDDFLEWFYNEDEEEDEDCDCKRLGDILLSQVPKEVIGNALKCRTKHEEEMVFQMILENTLAALSKEDPKEKPFKYQGEEREKLNNIYIKLNKDLEDSANICIRNDNSINRSIYDSLLKSVLGVFSKLQERVGE